MARLLKVQQAEVEQDDPAALKAFGISLLCSLFDIFEDDLQPDEMKEIERFCQNWSKK